MNTEEVYRNLRKTTAEIQNYSFESKLDRDTNSKDSGISQMGGGSGGGSSSRSGGGGGDGGNGIGGVHSMIDSFAAMSASTCTLVANGSNGNNGHTNDGHPYRAAAAPSMGYFDGGLGDCDLSPSTATTTESNTPENTVRMDGHLNGQNHGHRMHGGLGSGGRGGGGGGGGGGGSSGGVTGGAGWATPEFKILEDGTLVFESECIGLIWSVFDSVFGNLIGVRSVQMRCPRWR